MDFLWCQAPFVISEKFKEAEAKKDSVTQQISDIIGIFVPDTLKN